MSPSIPRPGRHYHDRGTGPYQHQRGARHRSDERLHAAHDQLGRQFPVQHPGLSRHPYECLRAYLALGVTTMIVVQGLINISVVLGIVPTKGFTLPMISSGGSSLFSTLVSLGILMNVSEHTSPWASLP